MSGTHTYKHTYTHAYGRDLLDGLKEPLILDMTSVLGGSESDHLAAMEDEAPEAAVQQGSATSQYALGVRVVARAPG